MYVWLLYQAFLYLGGSWDIFDVSEGQGVSHLSGHASIRQTLMLCQKTVENLETIHILCLFYIKIVNLQFFFKYVVFGPVILCIFFSQVARLRVIYTPKCASDCPLQAMHRVLKPTEKAKGISSPVSRRGNFRLHTMKRKVSIAGTPCFCQLSQVYKFRTESLKKQGGWWGVD